MLTQAKIGFVRAMIMPITGYMYNILFLLYKKISGKNRYNFVEWNLIQPVKEEELESANIHHDIG
jgi:hypothetical protein